MQVREAGKISAHEIIVALQAKAKSPGALSAFSRTAVIEVSSHCLTSDQSAPRLQWQLRFELDLPVEISQELWRNSLSSS